MNSDEKFKLLMQIRNTQGTSNKIALLARHPEMKSLLRTIYNPFMKFNISAQGVPGEGSRVFDEGTSVLLRSLFNCRLSGSAALRTVRAYQRDLTPESAKLLDILLDKNARIGIAAKEINKLWPGTIPTHDVMLAKLFEVERCKFPMYVSPKIDGVRGKFVNGTIFSRNGHAYRGLDHICRTLPFEHEFDGELVIPGKHFQEISGAIRNDQDCPDAVLMVFDCPTLPGDFSQRYSVFSSLVPNVVYHTAVNTMEELLDLHDGYKQAGFEGSVVKTMHYMYKGTRSYDWMKIKDTLDADLRVTGVFEGEFKYTGMLGGIIVDFEGKPNKVGTGFSDQQREFFWRYPEKIIGRIAEVQYMEKTRDGNLRHSRFKGLRFDKD